MSDAVSSDSPRIALLRAALNGGQETALDAFWRKVVAAVTPLLEPIPGDDRHMLATFVWRPGRDLSNVVIYCPLERPVQNNRMARLDATDLWYKTFRVDTDVRSPYWFSPDDTLLPYYDEKDWAARSKDWVADPLNPHRVPEFPPTSVLVMPDAPPQPWSAARPGVPAGQVREHIVPSAILGGLAAAFAALRRPDVFGNVLSQSGAFYRQRAGDPDFMWLPRHVATSPTVPVRFALTAGRLETWPTVGEHAPSLLLGNQQMRDALRAKGYDVRYREFAGGHDYHCWEGVLPAGLIALMAGKQSEGDTIV